MGKFLFLICLLIFHLCTSSCRIIHTVTEKIVRHTLWIPMRHCLLLGGIADEQTLFMALLIQVFCSTERMKLLPLIKSVYNKHAFFIWDLDVMRLH